MASDESTASTQRQRVLAVKLEFNFKVQEGEALFNLVRDLSWQCAHYYNEQSRSKWAQIKGWRVDPAANDKTDISKQTRRLEKMNLSGAVYSAIEQELQGAWQRDGKRILAGAPLPERRPTAALVIRGHKRKNESGVRIELENEQFVAYLAIQSKDSPGGCWVRIPIARNTRRDEHQGPVLLGMVSGSIPIAKAAVQIKQHSMRLQLNYALPHCLPAMGNREATLGPLMPDGRLNLRTETQTKDFRAVLLHIHNRKDQWDATRRRVLAQVGKRKGHARIKRQVLARENWGNWLNTRLHEWSREMIDWLSTQGVSTLHVAPIETGDWPAAALIEKLIYKGQDAGITVDRDADVATESGSRAVKAELGRTSKKVARRARAVRELRHQLGETA